MRSQAVDALRGVALVAMIAYHTCWFADDHGVIDLDFAALPWRVYQRTVAGTFFLLVGVGLWLARDTGRFLGRLGRIGLCAAVVTAASLALDPARPVWMGVLHVIFLASVVAKPLVPLGPLAAIPGTAIALVGATVSDPRFDRIAWTGLGTTVPMTFDHQPAVMWIGVVLIGIAVGPRAERLALSSRPLAWLGRRSLWIYMAHVPVLYGLFAVVG